MSPKEDIKVLAKFDELSDNGNDKERTKWQIPEAWEAEATEVNWTNVPNEVKEAIREVGYDPNEILRWGGICGKKKAVKWALENGADINQLKVGGDDADVIAGLATGFPLDFTMKIVENYVTSRKLRQAIYEYMLIGAACDKNEALFREILANRLDVDRLNERIWEVTADCLSAKFLEEIAKKYVTGEKMRQAIYKSMLITGLRARNKKKITVVLESGLVDLNVLGDPGLWGLCKSFPTDFIKEIISNYNIKGKARSILLKGVFYKGLKKRCWEDIVWALENGVRIGKEDSEMLKTFWRKKRSPRR